MNLAVAMGAAVGLAGSMSGASGATDAVGTLRLASPFGDRMVLQRDARVPVWGEAPPGQAVTVRLGDVARGAVADARGRWRVDLPPLSVATGATLVASGGGQTVSLADVAVGDVWLCSGQSNMEWPLSKSDGGEAAAAAADRPALRFYVVPKLSAEEPRDFCEASWQVCTPATAAAFSGAGYHFGVDIQAALGVPVGLIQSAWSGAAAESWIPPGSLRADPRLTPLVARWEKYRDDFPRLQAEYEAAVAAARKAKEAGAAPGPAPRQPKSPSGPEKSLGGLYNGMLHPLIPFAIRGVLWYQGENNVMNIPEYRVLFPFLIRTWRGLWGQGDFPFLFVQIANFGPAATQPEDSPWAHLRDSQRSGLAEPRTAMVTAIDIGGDFHALNKRDVGLRLARAAKAVAYGMGVAYSGPVFDGADFGAGGAVRVRFRGASGRLTVRGGGPLRGFTIAGADRRFVFASAELEGGTVRVWSDAVSEPVAVRYNWATSPGGNLYDGEDLPAAPFRTDDWPATQTPE